MSFVVAGMVPIDTLLTVNLRMWQLRQLSKLVIDAHIEDNAFPDHQFAFCKNLSIIQESHRFKSTTPTKPAILLGRIFRRKTSSRQHLARRSHN